VKDASLGFAMKKVVLGYYGEKSLETNQKPDLKNGRRWNNVKKDESV